MRTILAPLVCFALAAAPSAYANEDCTQDAMLVFDGSGSMAEMGYNGLDHPRIFEARTALHNALPNVTPIRRIGLAVYGPGGDGETCSHVDIRFGPTPNAAPRILTEIDALQPGGNTALTRAVAEAAEVLNYREDPGTIVLVTDGKETCGGATCQLAATLAAEGAALTVHVIGFRVRSDFFGWEGTDSNPEVGVTETVARCLADRTGGLYVSAEGTEALEEALNQTLGCPVFGHAAPGLQRIPG